MVDGMYLLLELMTVVVHFWNLREILDIGYRRFLVFVLVGGFFIGL